MGTKEVVSIETLWELEGNNGVNFDSKSQSYYFNQLGDGKAPQFYSGNNIFHKGDYYKKDGILSKTLKISNDCLNHEIFSEQIPFQSTIIMHDDRLLLESIASKSAIIRGYCYLESKTAIKRKKSLNIGSAIQTSKETISIMNVHSNSGEKSSTDTSGNPEDNTEEKKQLSNSTSFFHKEEFGAITYDSKGFFDLSEVQFISMDSKYDRLAVDPDLSDEFIKVLSRNLESEVEAPAYYSKSGAVASIEKGITLTNDQVKSLVAYALKRMLGFNLVKASGYARTKSLKIKLVRKGVLDDMLSTGGKWITIKSESDIDALDFDVATCYQKVDDLKIEIFKESQKTRDTLKNKKVADKLAVKEERKARKSKNDGE